MRATLAHAWSRRSANTNLRDTSSGVAPFSYLVALECVKPVGCVNGDRHVERRRRVLPMPHLDHVTDGYVDTVRIPIQGIRADEVLNDASESAAVWTSGTGYKHLVG
jgi:hypothetical protein